MADESNRESSPKSYRNSLSQVIHNGTVGEAYTNEAYEDNEFRSVPLTNGIKNHTQSIEMKNGRLNHVTNNLKSANGVHRLSNGDKALDNIYSLANHINGKDNYFEKENMNQTGEKTIEMPKTNGEAPEPKKDKDDDDDGCEKEVPVNFFSLFRYSSPTDKLLMFFGCIIALCVSTSLPLVIILFGNIVDSFVEHHPSPASNTTADNVTETTMEASGQDDDFLPRMARLCSYLTAVACGVLCFNYIMVSFFSITAANQAFKIKCLFMKSVLRQDIGWFDTNQTGDFATRITADLTRVQDGIGEKVCMCVAFLSQTFVSIIVALCYGWKLTLVVLCIMPVLSISMAVIAKIQAKVSGNEMSSYGAAGAVAEEVLSAIRTVVAFGGESKEIKRYDKYLQIAKKQGVKRGLLTSIGAGLVWFCIYCAYALAFWYGVKLIVEGRKSGEPEYNPSNLVIVFFNVMMGAMGIGQTAPYFEAFNLARGAASKVFRIIERVPPIDSSSPQGKTPASLVGNITLKDVHFKYPARPEVPILRGLTLKIKFGETVALVGSSGCGKSTVIQLIQRYYDTIDGHVLIDDNDVKDLNVGWLRDNIGVVGQEPVLFSTTISENIRYGKRSATDAEIEAAAKAANVHDFITGLPQHYNTLVGERGTQLSGGQKQRIAIARALVRNPKILLLDEATSALDTESESIVQAALDQARQGRTTIIVAHRLSTIRTADKIVAISDGAVKEIGTHDELMAQKGVYYQLVTTQVGDDSEENMEENELENDDVFDENLPVLQRTLSVLSSGSCTSDDTNNSRRYSGVERTLSTISTVKHSKSEVKTDVEPSKQRLLKLSLPEWPYLTVGGVAAMVTGLFIPLYGILFGEILGLLSEEDAKIMSDISFYSSLFVGMAIGSGISTFLQTFMFTIAGERLTSRLRKLTFTNMICQDMSWFDLPQNSIGSLCSRLSSDASQVQGAGGSRISTVLQALSTLIAAIIVGLYYDWRLGLVVLAFVPLVLLATYFESRIISGHTFSDKTALEEASKVAIEAIESIRTVASLHQEEAFYIQFSTALATPLKRSRTSSHVRGLIYGFAQSIPTFAYAAALYYGSVRVSQNEMIYADLFKVMEAVIFGTAMVGQAVAFAPDYQKAKTASVRIFELLDQKPRIDVFSKEGSVMTNVSGRIEFRKVYFNYPSRPRVKILRGLNLAIEPGKTVALVGSSGCGKSTCVQLIERFYETLRGIVSIDGKNVESIRVSSLRSQLGLVSQEPVLFSYSLAENIAYGDNERNVSMDEIITAAKNANIHSFISALPQGYSTAVGDKGTQLSGGQKQRIAIARALVRNPKILLLDEATSALDAESEKVVQDALDKASDGRTCITIAHRLTTIQNADMIAVIHKGHVVEKGTHQELLALRGHYYNLHNVQSGTK